MDASETWIEGLPAAITVTDREGIIITMNARSRETFAEYGGGALVGRSLYECHSESSREKLRAMYESQESNSYTIEKNGQKKIIHQIPWYQGKELGGLIEIALPIPNPLPNFIR